MFLDMLGGDEAVRLVDSNGDDLPYLPTTLPQEKSGTVTITPTNKRLSECKLTSVERPRSVSPRTPGNFEEFIKNGKQKSNDKMQVKLPTQDVKTSSQAKQQTTWEAFTSQGLEDPRQAREKMMKNRQQTVDIGVFQKEQKKSGKDVVSPTTPTGWVNCEELPSPKKPVRRYDSDEDETSSSRTSSFKHQSSSIDSSSSSSSSASKGSNISKRSSASASSARSSTSSKSSSSSSSRSSIQSKSSSSSASSGKGRPSAIPPNISQDKKSSIVSKASAPTISPKTSSPQLPPGRKPAQTVQRPTSAANPASRSGVKEAAAKPQRVSSAKPTSTMNPAKPPKPPKPPPPKRANTTSVLPGTVTGGKPKTVASTSSATRISSSRPTAAPSSATASTKPSQLPPRPNKGPIQPLKK